ncbi:MAG TPA: VOC family protein [Abditibacteriaceae bacterium]|jgi:catechol 2,3-dioxygenase-like lactoylglutathione lyase family enzyme
MKINGILESALYVGDLERAAQFYERLFGFARLLSDERMIALNMSEAPRQVLLLFHKGGSIKGAEVPGGQIPPHDGNGNLHFAFAIKESDVEAWRAKLQAHNVEIISEVRPPQGGISLYFRDPDGHLAELATPRIWDME